MIRLMRGQVVVKERYGTEFEQYQHLIIPELGTTEERQRARTSHRGVVVGIGEPAQTRNGADIVPEFKIGDEVVFHFQHSEKCWTRPWPEDGEQAVWIPQMLIDGVVES